MEKKFIIKDLVEDEYYYGTNPEPVFDRNLEGSILTFDSEYYAEKRINEELQLNSRTRNSRILTIVPIFVGL